jgi:hypothetical protein
MRPGAGLAKKKERSWPARKNGNNDVQTYVSVRSRTSPKAECMGLPINERAGMKARRAVSLAGLLLGVVAGCTEYVPVTLLFPPGLRYDSIRVTKVVDGLVVDRLEKGLDGGDVHSIDISMPDHGKVSLRAKAYLALALVADGELEVMRSAGEQKLTLKACEPPIMDAAPAASCQPSPLHPVVDGGNDVGTEGPVRDGGAEQPPPDTSLACYPDAVEDARPAGGLSPPASIPAGCQTYCDAMQANCISAEFYNNSIRECLFACALLNWDPESSTGDSLKCRTNAAQAAAAPAQNHRDFCHFAMPNSAPGCGMPCEVYCRMGSIVCPADFPSESDCKTACTRLVKAGSAVDRDNPAPQLDCRLFYLEKAIFNRELCGWAAPDNMCPGPNAGCGSVNFY